MPGFTFRTLTKWVKPRDKGWRYKKVRKCSILLAWHAIMLCSPCWMFLRTALCVYLKKKKIFSAALKSNKMKPVHIYRPVWVAIYFVEKSELHSGGCLIVGRGCGWRNLVVSQLFANSRASHCGCGQVQEPGVDRQQDDCRSDTSIIGTNVLIGWLGKTSNHAALALLELWLCFLSLVCLKCAHFVSFLSLALPPRSLRQGVSPTRRQEDQQEEDVHQKGWHQPHFQRSHDLLCPIQRSAGKNLLHILTFFTSAGIIP